MTPSSFQPPTRRRYLHVPLLAAALAVTACAGGRLPHVISPRDVPGAQGKPEVRSVRDLGDLEEIPSSGALPIGDADGTFVVGELVLVEGKNFGKLPTVLVGGRPATVLARTGGGGIVTRVPDGVLAGDVEVEVSHPRGKGARSIAVHRYGLVAQGDADAIYVFDIDRTRAALRPPTIPLRNPRYIRFSADGSIAYVASGVASSGSSQTTHAGKLSVLAMGAGGGPRVVQDVPVAFRFVVALAVAERAPLLAVVGETQLQLFSLIDARQPAPYQPFTLPAEIARAGVVAADLDARARVLAIAVGDGNRLVSVDVSQPEAPKIIAQVELLPGERMPLVRDMRFGPDGETLWVVSGDSALSASAGKQPTQITAVTLSTPDSGTPALAVWRTSAVPGATAPLRLTVARGQPLASGATVRTPPEKAAVFVSAVDPRLLQLSGLNLFEPEGQRRAVSILKPIAEPGMLVRTSVEGGGGPLFQVPTVLTSIDLSPDSQIVLAATCRFVASGEDRISVEFGVTSASLWGQIEPTFTRLADMPLNTFRPPFLLGHVRIQP